MTLSQNDLVAIEEIIEKKMSGTCQCDLSKEAQAEVGHLFGMIKDTGRGDYAAGIEIIRDVLKTLGRWKAIIDKIGGAMLIAIGVGVVSSLGWAIKVVWKDLNK